MFLALSATYGVIHIVIYTIICISRQFGIACELSICKGCRYGQDVVSIVVAGRAAGSTHFSNSHEGTRVCTSPFILLLLYTTATLGHIILYRQYNSCSAGIESVSVHDDRTSSGRLDVLYNYYYYYYTYRTVVWLLYRYILYIGIIYTHKFLFIYTQTRCYYIILWSRVYRTRTRCI